jgi:amidohydrolase
MDLTQNLRQELVRMRRLFYQFPELSWEEAHTARAIAGYMESYGLSLRTDVGGHGLVAELAGELPGPVIAYRADMDALPIYDTLEKSYRSMNLGVKHACGHDVHMTIALGTAKTLSSLRHILHGTLRFIFQPAEEALDGAQAMIDSGVLQLPVPRAILALHAFPLPVGSIGLTRGQCLAGMEEFRIRFDAPRTMLPDLIEATLPALQALSTHTPPATPQAFNDLINYMVTGDYLENSLYLSCWQSVGAGNAHITGLVSLVDYSARQTVRSSIRQTLDEVIGDSGTGYTLWTSFENPPLMNDARLIQQLRRYVVAVVGRESVVDFKVPYPFAHEDFALYVQQVPGAMLWLGTANHERAIHSMLHSPDYDVDEQALVTGTALMSYLLLKLTQELVSL